MREEFVENPPILVQTKLALPRLLHGVVNRPRLQRLTEQVKVKKLTLLIAPTGYGKTTLLVTWAEELLSQFIPPNWISLDEGDNDPRLIARYILAAFRQSYAAGDLSAEKYLLGAVKVDFICFITCLVNDLCRIPKDFVLILDDFHRITNPDIQDGVRHLITYAPSSFHLILASRTCLPFELGLLRARRDLLEINTSKLSFSSAELDDLLIQVEAPNLSAEQLAILETKTGGWAAGLQLMLMVLKDGEFSQNSLDAISGQHPYVFDYLIEEVLEKQPARIQEFLLKTSILERFCEDLCQVILETVDVSDSMAYLQTGNLFVSALDSQSGWYRYHPLFAEALQKKLFQDFPEESRLLRIKAFHWFFDKRLFSEAVQQALEGQLWNEAAEIITKVDISTLLGYEVLLSQWIEAFPAQVIEENPAILLRNYFLLNIRGKVKESERFLKQAESLLTNPVANKANSEFLNFYAFGLSYSDDMKQIQMLARQALENLPPADSEQRCIAMGLMAGGVDWRRSAKKGRGIDPRSFKPEREHGMEWLLCIPIFRSYWF